MPEPAAETQISLINKFTFLRKAKTTHFFDASIDNNREKLFAFATEDVIHGQWYLYCSNGHPLGDLYKIILKCTYFRICFVTPAVYIKLLPKQCRGQSHQSQLGRYLQILEFEWATGVEHAELVLYVGTPECRYFVSPLIASGRNWHRQCRMGGTERHGYRPGSGMEAINIDLIKFFRQVNSVLLASFDFMWSRIISVVSLISGHR